MRTLVLMSGGFHPFHPGHLALYNSAKQAFPGGDVVVGATNVQAKRPFSFKDKAMLATIAGVDKGHFVEVNRQFSVKGEPNIESRIQNPDDTILIFVRSVKDANDPVLQPWKSNPDGSVPMTKGSKNHPSRPTSDYLLPYEGNENRLEPMNKHAYIAFLPVKEFGSANMTSATQIRNTWPTLDEKGKQQFVMGLYPATQKNNKLLSTVVNILNKNLSGISEPVVEPKKSSIAKLKNKKLAENLRNLINNARPLLKEAPIEKKIQFIKLLKESMVKTNEISFFKPGTKKPEVEPEEDDKLGYDHLFKSSEPTNPQPKVYHGWEEYEQEKKHGEVDEAKIHFTDPNARINVYYVTPKLEYQGKSQQIAHNIPYSTLQPLMGKLKEKFPNLNLKHVVWAPLGDDRYGHRITENQDYLEEK